MITKLIDNFHIAYIGLMSNKLRAGLTMLGITIGIAAVIILVSIGQAVETFITGQFSSIGSNLIAVIANTSVSNDITGNAVPITESDVLALADPFRAPDLRLVAPNVSVRQAVSYDGRESASQVSGVTDAYFDVLSMDVVLGRSISEDDLNGAARIALIDEQGVESLFNNEYPIGERIRIGNVYFQIEGVVQNSGGILGTPGTAQIFIPITAAQRYFGGAQSLTGEYGVTAIFIEAVSESRTASAIDQIAVVLREEHDLDEDEDNDFQVIAQTAILDSLATITGLLTVFLGIIASISLLVGGIGIMNIMLVTVTERTKEIGLRKAVGAQWIDILLQFLIEAITLALMGGVLGTAVAALMAFLVSVFVPDLQVVIQVSSIILVTVICVSIGAFFGAYPANRAARLNPIDALRYE